MFTPFLLRKAGRIQCSEATRRSYSTGLAAKHLRRSFLYVPSSSTKMLEKSRRIVSDTIVYDLEDSVAPTQKHAARENLRTFLSTIRNTSGSEVAVRVNAPDSPAFEDDVRLAAISSHSATPISSRTPITFVLPKVHSKMDLERLDQVLQAIQRSQPVEVIAIVESARALWSIGDIASWRSPWSRVSAIVFGAEDYCADTSIIRTRSRAELLYARSHVVNAARAFGIQALDMVCVNYKDAELLKEESEDGRQLGFDGKQVIHPDQVAIVQDTFVPSSREIERATRIIHQMRVAHFFGKGAFGLAQDGATGEEMIDEPMLKQAHRVLERARKAGLLPTGSQDT